MSLRFYFDQHVPAPIASGLQLRGIDVITAEGDASKDLDDEPLLARATVLGRVMVSNDRDLLAITTRWLRIGQHFGGLVYFKERTIPYGKAIDDLLMIAEVHGLDEITDRVEYLPL